MIEPLPPLNADYDPGPLDDRKLERVLRSPGYTRASKTHDRVQDAFARMRLEKATAEALRDAAMEAMLDEEKLMAELEDELHFTRRDRWSALIGGLAFGCAVALLIAHALGF